MAYSAKYAVFFLCDAYEQTEYRALELRQSGYETKVFPIDKNNPKYRVGAKLKAIVLPVPKKNKNHP